MKNQTKNIIFLAVSIILLIIKSFFVITSWRIFLVKNTSIGFLIGSFLGQATIPVIISIIAALLIWQFRFHRQKSIISIFPLVFLIVVSLFIFLNLFIVYNCWDTYGEYCWQ